MFKKFILSFLISCIGFGAVFTGADKIMSKDIEKEELVKNTEVKEEGIKDDVETLNEKEVVVLLLGIDSNDLQQEKGVRTDTIMLGKANFDTGEIDLLSIPRDTRVSINGRLDKINHAHSFGGTDLTIKTIEDFLDLEIDHYVKIDFAGIQEVVNAIGGVEIDVPQRMVKSDPTAKPPLNIDLYPGTQILDGKKAHDFLRFRDYPDGDIGRVKAQQYFMKELGKQILSPSNIFRLDKLIKTYYDYVDTNIPMSNMIKYAFYANKLDIDNMETGMIPGYDTRIDGISYWIYDENETTELVENMFKGHNRIERSKSLEERNLN